jgi:hypothetical protein
MSGTNRRSGDSIQLCWLRREDQIGVHASGYVPVLPIRAVPRKKAVPHGLESVGSGWALYAAQYKDTTRFFDNVNNDADAG